MLRSRTWTSWPGRTELPIDEIPENELASHYAKAVADLDEHDLSMLAAWHASMEVGTPLANKDFLVGAFKISARTAVRR